MFGLRSRLLPLANRNLRLNAALPKAFFSSKYSGSYVSANLDSETGIADLTMHAPPVNSFNLPFLTEFVHHLDRIEADNSIRAVIVRSSLKHFCAGIDMPGELLNAKEAQLREFYRYFQDTWFKLFSSSKIVIGLANGQAVAGGCVLLMCCDYRIATPVQKSYSIAAGRIGLLTPPWVIDTLTHNIGPRKTELMIQSCRSLSSDEALQYGIIDEIVETGDKAYGRAVAVANEWMKSPSFSHEITKASVRRKIIDRFTRSRQSELDSFCKHILKDSIQANIKNFIDDMKKSKASK